MDSASRRTGYRVALLCVGVAVYASSLSGVFVFDDFLAIEQNPHVHTLSPLWYAAWAEHESPLAGRPIPALSLALNYAVGGLAPLGYKAVNLMLHLGCALALFAAVGGALRLPVLRARFGDRSDELAFAIAGLWVVHPLASEPVNYVTQRTESWMALAYLSAIACTARAAVSSDGARWRVLAVCVCAAGMASKEVMVSAPLMLLLFERAYSGPTIGALLRAHRGFYAGLAGCWLILAALVAATYRSDTVGFDEGVSLTDYLWNQGWVLPRYLRLTVWPAGLTHDWGLPRAVVFGEVWPGVLGAGAAFVGAVWLSVRRPALGWPLLFVFAVLAPTSSVLPIVTEVAAERRMYLALAALLAVGVIGVAEAFRRAGLGPWPARVAWLVVVVSLGVSTSLHNRSYASALVLWQRAIAEFPDNARAHTNVGQALIDLGRAEESVTFMRRAVELQPDFAEGHNELGVALGLLGLHGEARRAFERSLELDPDGAKANVNLALLELAAGERDAARRLLRRALQLDPGSSKASLQLAWLLATDPEVGDRRAGRAVALAETAISRGAAGARPLDVLAAAYAAAGDFDRAVALAVRAQEIATGEDAPRLRIEIARRLKGYRSGERWIED